MKKKAFTLIELVVVMAVIVILIPLGIKSYKLSQDISLNLKKKGAVLEVYDLLSFSKYYCKSHNTTGTVAVYNKEMFFWDCNNNSFQRKIILPQGLTFKGTVNLNCDYNGILSAKSIYIQDDNGRRYRISIAVGVDNISIYEE